MHGRTQFSARDSRIGFRIQAPETSYLRVSGVLEMDFLRNSDLRGRGFDEFETK